MFLIIDLNRRPFEQLHQRGVRGFLFDAARFDPDADEHAAHHFGFLAPGARLQRLRHNNAQRPLRKRRVHRPVLARLRYLFRRVLTLKSY